MTKRNRDLRSLLHVPQRDLQVQVASRLERMGFHQLRSTHVQVLSQIDAEDGVRLADLVASVALPKQTVGDLIDDLEGMKMVERFPDPDHGVIKRVRLGPKGKVWAAEVRRVAQATEARWTTRLGAKKMKSLRALLEELAATVENGATSESRASDSRSDGATRSGRRPRT